MLDFYEYSRSDIAALVRRCHYDELDAKKSSAGFKALSCLLDLPGLHLCQEPNSDSCSQYHRGQGTLSVLMVRLQMLLPDRTVQTMKKKNGARSRTRSKPRLAAELAAN